MTDHDDPSAPGDDAPVRSQPGSVHGSGARPHPTAPPPDGREEAELIALDERAYQAARGLRAHVDQHLQMAEAGLAVPPRGPGATWRSKAVAVAAVAALVVGFAATQGPGGGEGRLELDDARRPELTAGLLTPLGPRDGRDSIQLPVTADPATGLRDGDAVVVRGEGFVPGESVGIVQCAREAGGDSPEVRGGVDACDISDYVNVSADEQGVAQGTYRIKRVLTTPLTGSVDCAAETGRCIVAMGAINDYDRSGGLAIELDPDVPPVDLPTVTASPTEDLAEGQVVSVQATGLTPGEPVQVQLCSSDPATCWPTGVTISVDEGGERYEIVGVRVDDAGDIDAEVTVWRFLPGGEPGTYVDCAISRCSLRLEGSTAPPTVPLRFRGDEPPPQTAGFGVAPRSGLAPGDEVVVAGEGFRPGSAISLSLCAQSRDVDGGPGGLGACMNLGDPVVVDDDGAFAVLRRVPEPPSSGGGQTCNPAGGCRPLPERAYACDGGGDHCHISVDGGWYGGEPGHAGAAPFFPPAPVPVTFRPGG